MSSWKSVRVEVPGSKGDRIVTATILAASLAGACAAFASWHSLAYGAIRVRGVDRTEGRVLVGALALSAALAGHHLFGGVQRARTVTLAIMVALVASGTYIYVMARPESDIHELVRKALDGRFRPGAFIAAGATLIAFVASVSCLRRGG